MIQTEKWGAVLDRDSLFTELCDLLSQREQDVLVTELRSQNIDRDFASSPSILPQQEPHVKHWLHIGSIESGEDFEKVLSFLKNDQPCKESYQYLDGEYLPLREELAKPRFYWLIPDKFCLESFGFFAELVKEILQCAQAYIIWVGEQIGLPQEIKLQYAALQISWLAAGSGFGITACAKMSRDYPDLLRDFSKTFRGYRVQCDCFISNMEQFITHDPNGALLETSHIQELLNEALENKKDQQLETLGLGGVLGEVGTGASSCFRGKTLVLCGAGPSLAEVVDLLCGEGKLGDSGHNGLDGRCIIAAAGSALPLLESAAVGVDLYFALDPYSAQAIRLRRVGNVAQPVIYRPRWHHRAKQLFTGPKMLAGGTSGYPLLDRAAGLSDPRLLKVEEGVNVCSFALNWARQMGFARIVLVGVDLAYEEAVPYPRFEGKKNKESRILEQWSSSQFYSFKSDLEGLCNDGQVRKTSNQWLIEREYIECFARDNPEIDLLRISSKGLQVDCAHVSPEELKTLFKESKDDPQIDRFNTLWYYSCRACNLLLEEEKMHLEQSIIDSAQQARAFFKKAGWKEFDLFLDEELLLHLNSADMPYLEQCLAFISSLSLYDGFLNIWDQVIEGRYHFIEKSIAQKGTQVQKIDLVRRRLYFLLKALKAVVEKSGFKSAAIAEKP